MKNIFSISLILIFFNSYAQTDSICNIDFKINIRVGNERISLDTLRDFDINYEMTNIGSELLIPYPKIGFEEDDFNFPNIITYTFKKGKYGNWEKINFYPGDAQYFDRGNLLIHKNEKKTFSVNFAQLCPISNKGKYLIQCFYRIKINSGYLVFPSNKILIEVI